MDRAMMPWDPALWLFLVFATGWWGGGVPLHDHTAVDQGGALGANVVGTSQLRTATGSASGSIGAGGSPSIALNDYSFAPNIQETDATIFIVVAGYNTADQSDTVARVALWNQDGASHTYVMRWRYLTATDNPVIYVLQDSSGDVVAVWTSDDPVKDAAGNEIIPIAEESCIAFRFKSSDLDTLSFPAPDRATAEAYILANKLNLENLSYRTLQLHAGDEAPASWIFNNCQLDSNGKLIVRADKIQAAALTTPQVETRTLLQRIWQGIVDFLTPSS
jgi:hypothetical protein